MSATPPAPHTGPVDPKALSTPADRRAARRPPPPEGGLAKPRRGPGRGARARDVPGAPAPLVRQRPLPRHLPGRPVRDRRLGGRGSARAFPDPARRGGGTDRPGLLRAAGRLRRLARSDAPLAGRGAAAEAPRGDRPRGAVGQQAPERDASASCSAGAMPSRGLAVDGGRRRQPRRRALGSRGTTAGAPASGQAAAPRRAARLRRRRRVRPSCTSASRRS